MSPVQEKRDRKAMKTELKAKQDQETMGEMESDVLQMK